MDRLALQDDDADVAVLELAASLQRLQQLLVVQVALAEVPADQGPGHHFALTHAVVGLVVDRARQQAVERPAMGVHRPERRHLVGHQLGGLGSVQLG